MIAAQKDDEEDVAGPLPANAAPGAVGLVEPGNIDLNNRPIHKNPDGSISTVRSMSFSEGGPEILVPTIADDGTPLTDEQAIALYRKTGKHLGKFDTPEAATAYAQQLHEDQAAKYLPQAAKPPKTREEASAAEAGDLEAEARDYEERGKAQAREQEIESGKLAEKGKTNEAAAAELAATLDQQRADHAAATAKAEEALTKYKNFQFQDFWPDSHTGPFINAVLGALGGFGAAVNGGHNEALSRIDEAMTRSYNKDLQRLRSTEQQYLWRKEGVKDLERYQAEQIDHLKIKYGYALDSIADKADSMAALAKGADKKAEFQALADKTRAAGAHLQRTGFDEALKNDLMRSEIERNKASADAAEARAKKLGRGGSGGGGTDALTQFAAAAGKLKPGDEIPPELVALGRKAGLKPDQIPDQIEKYAKKGQSGKAAGGVDPTKIVRDLDGTPRGLAPSGRGGAAAIQSDLRTNQQALDQLKKLRDKNKILPTGPEFHDAILALAAVTTAGKTDTTTAHEKGAITNAIGMPSREGIDDKIRQIETRIEQIKTQLAPLPEGYSEERGGDKASTGPNAAQQATLERLKAMGL